MLPGIGGGPFDDEAWFFEPWWPGVLATAVVDGAHVSLVASQLTDPLPAFPELRSMSRQVRGGSAVMPGTLVVLDADGRPDIDALHRRLADPDDRPGVGAFIAADVLERDGRPLTEQGFASRRAGLLDAVLDGDRFLVSRGLKGEGHTLAVAAASMGIEGISARRLEAPWRPGVTPEAWLRLAVGSASVGPIRPLLVLLQRLPLD
jgi:bifunctional non-homologous end joining protein LigD